MEHGGNLCTVVSAVLHVYTVRSLANWVLRTAIGPAILTE